VAEHVGQPTWWLYRDWGPIKTRFNFYSEAETHLTRASRSQPNNPGINAALAFMRSQQGDYEASAELFEKALTADPDHHYSLTYYPRVLERLGDYDRADALRQRLRELEDKEWYGREDLEYDIEIEED
jgi:tetratricopeptide (TPR) repeat protein